MSSPTLPEYVAQVKSELSSITDGRGTIKVVMGNEAGDTDSMASALVVAFFMGVSQKEIVVPIINYPRGEQRLRKDNVEALSAAKISVDDLVFVEELNLKDLAQAGRLQLTLVDHNELSPRQDFLAGSIVSIIDHHKDSNLYTEMVSGASRNVQFPIGSCTTLITEAMLKSEVGQQLLSDSSVSLLLQSTMMLDTNNLANEAKTTDLDRAMLTVSREKVPGVTADWLHKLKKLRKDITGFSVVDLMLKDMKFSTVGEEKFAISSIPASLKKMGALASKESLESMASEIKAFMLQNDLAITFLLTKGTDPWKRIVVVTSIERWSTMKESFAQLIASDKEYGGIALKGEATDFGIDGIGSELAVDSANVVVAVYNFASAASRKQWLPALQDFFKASEVHCCNAEDSEQEGEEEGDASP